MIQNVKITENQIRFAAKSEKQQKEEESKILPNTCATRLKQGYDKTLSAVTEYPVKGLKGDVNSDFYEFLSMGIIPYVAGSAMFMTLFNIFPSVKGKKMALGVLLYGLGKTLSNKLVTKPVTMYTGVDIDLPYRNVYYPLPTKPGAQAEIFPQHQQRKVYDSKEFFRKDLLAKDPEYGKAYYDRIAKKVGLGDNLNDSVTETTPIIQNIISTTKTAKTLSSYAWAATGVGLAMQNCWEDFFTSVSNRSRYIAKPNEGYVSKTGNKILNTGKNVLHLSKEFITTLLKSCKSMWQGTEGTKGYMKHMGKAWIMFSALLTVGSVANVIYRAKHMANVSNEEHIDETKESMVI